MYLSREMWEGNLSDNSLKNIGWNLSDLVLSWFILGNWVKINFVLYGRSCRFFL